MRLLQCHWYNTYLFCAQIWDFKTAQCEAAMSGHGGDVKTCDWHPCSSVVASGSKDTVIKLWDARAGGASLATLHGHKATITQVPRTLILVLTHSCFVRGI